jgi:hypothetical protein
MSASLKGQLDAVVKKSLRDAYHHLKNAEATASRGNEILFKGAFHVLKFPKDTKLSPEGEKILALVDEAHEQLNAGRESLTDSIDTIRKILRSLGVEIER